MTQELLKIRRNVKYATVHYIIKETYEKVSIYFNYVEDCTLLQKV